MLLKKRDELLRMQVPGAPRVLPWVGGGGGVYAVFFFGIYSFFGGFVFLGVVLECGGGKNNGWTNCGGLFLSLRSGGDRQTLKATSHR